ncbi:MAG TPA: CapA family protein [Candidatus Limiplasma sp.]|nr:CapA family protein [Candidatus Limiplasma sp.]HPR77936.1 CapA family protein [Candidatus Limiplasma sp.]
MRRALAVLVAAVLLGAPAIAETKIYTFPYTQPPAALNDTAHTVAEGETDVVLTFAGDCTLGGERAGGKRFAGVMEKNGYAYPFANLQGLFDSDDLTMVNLEGVLSDERSDKVRKKFNFIGKPEFAEILTQGNVECVTLANNHALDYGERGKRDTVSALTAKAIAYCDEQNVTILEKDGVRIGFTASGLQLNRDTYLKQAQALKALGCAAIVHNMHTGEEYADTLTPNQQRTAEFLSDNGAALVVGHHPHVAQGIALYGKTYVAFSLGNCVFGGNSDPDDYDACVLRATLRFRNGTLASETIVLWPIRVSGTRGRNDYQPVLLSGEDAKRVLDKMQKTSAFPLNPMVDGQGAVQPTANWQ